LTNTSIETIETIDLLGKEIPRYIAVEGPICVGKTTLTKLLADTFNYDTFLEAPHENPFIDRFYAGEKNSALPTQLFFLLQRANQLNELRQGGLFHPIHVADFLIEKDYLFAQITLDGEELKLYEQIYQNLTLNAPTPDLVIYLQAPTHVLLKRIKKRAVPAQQSINAEYLNTLNDAYTRFFHYYDRAPLLIVNTADVNWQDSPGDYRKLVEHALTLKSGRHYYNSQTVALPE